MDHLNKMGRGCQDSSLEPSDQVVKVEEGWVDLKLELLADPCVAKTSKYPTWYMQDHLKKIHPYYLVLGQILFNRTKPGPSFQL